MKAARGWCLTGLWLAGALGAMPVGAGVLSDLSDDEKDWVELAVDTLPPSPVESALAPIRLTRAARHRHFVDRRSVSVGSDGVVRFTLSVKPEAGPLQSSYAGLHCRTGQWKIYALSSADGTWRNATAPAWQPIQRQSRDSVRSDLYEYFFCTGNGPAGDPPELLRRLATESGLRSR